MNYLFDIVAFVDSGASHSFAASKLLQKYNLNIVLDTSMVVTLASGSQVEICKTCYVPIITCTMSNKPVCCMVLCRILPTLQQDLVLGVDWLQQVNPVIDS